MHSETITYRDGSTELEGVLAYDDTRTGRRPGVLVAHAWAGSGEFEWGRAKALAELGYVGLALDMYGKGKRGSSPEENARLLQPFLDDRVLVSRRINAAFETTRGLDQVDPARIGAIGYSFGGLCALDLARNGADLRGAASFWGLLDGRKEPPNKPIKAKVLVLHGSNDPFIPDETFKAFTREMTAAGVDWQIHQYGHVVHAFSEPGANRPEDGSLYSPTADRRSWATMKDFFQEVFA